MQTFLPYPSFQASVSVLDKKRLGNQIYREALTLIRGGWKNHPASKMWRGFEWHLASYALHGLVELKKRKAIADHLIRKHAETFINIQSEHKDNGLPPWIGDDRFHASHRSNLLRKDPEWYGQFGWTESHDLPYVWPV